MELKERILKLKKPEYKFQVTDLLIKNKKKSYHLIGVFDGDYTANLRDYQNMMYFLIDDNE